MSESSREKITTFAIQRTETMQIYKFNHILKPVLWGGDKLAAFKGLPPQDEPIGESWELSAVPGRESVVADGPDKGLTLTQLIDRYGATLLGDEVYRRFGNRFPLLIKFIDARRDLSIQVHPGDDMAMRHHGTNGKTEMWYIVDADDGATIRIGFNRPLSPEEFDRRITDGTILDVVNVVPSRPGHVFHIPAGQIHTIGAGNLLVEIQQSSDITYRVFDYNRRDADGNLRELHTSMAREALSYEPFDGLVNREPRAEVGEQSLLACPFFDVRHVDLRQDFTMEWDCSHSFVVLICLEGETELRAEDMEPVPLRQGETVLVPAAVKRLEMLGTARLLAVAVPQKCKSD